MYKQIMKTMIRVFAILMLVAVLAGLAAVAGFDLAGLGSPTFGSQHPTALPRALGGIFGLVVAAAAMVFALAVTVVSLAGAFLAVVFALVLTGLILLVVALPFLLPLVFPLVLIFAVVLVARRTNRPRAA